MKIALGTAVLSLSVLTGVIVADSVSSQAPSRSTDSASVAPTSAKTSVFAFAKAWTGKPVFQSGPNCFGTTLAAFHQIPKPRFANDGELREFLKSCVSTTVARPGDVGVLYDPQSDSQPAEVHSFVVIDSSRVFYKNGVEAAGAFVTGKTAAMFKDFRTNFNQAACERVSGESMEETGLPCPTVVKYYRCNASLQQRDVEGFAASERDVWTEIEKLDLAIANASLSKEGPRLGETQDMLTLIRDLNLKLETLDSQTTTLGALASKRFVSLALARTESFLSFLGFSADSNRWSRTDLKELLGELNQSRGKLISYKKKARL